MKNTLSDYSFSELEIKNISFQPDEPVWDIDGNKYDTLFIENNGTKQTWMLQNLRVTQYRNKEKIQYITNPDIWKEDKIIGKCCDYDNKPENSEIYGKLYNWHVTKNEICPQGWKIPTIDDWMTLISIFGGMGGKLKESGNVHWYNNNQGTNESKFTALPGGYRDGNGNFAKINTTGVWWSSTKINDQLAGYFLLRNSLGCANIFKAGINCGMSIRCIKET